MAALLLSVLAFVQYVGYTSANVATPMTKVVELLDNIKAKLVEDGHTEARIYNEYKRWCDKEHLESTATIKGAKSKISELTADLANEEAFRQKVSMEIEATIAEVAKNEADLRSAEKVRHNEHQAHIQEERSLIESIDALERSLAVLAKKAPASAAAALPQTASLAQVASLLKNTFQRSSDLKLDAAQLSTLNEFTAMAERTHDAYENPSFLQVSSVDHAGPSSGGVANTLQQILERTKRSKDEQMLKEQQAQQAFELFSVPLKQEIEFGNRAIAEKKNQIAKSDQTSATKTSERNAAQELLTSTQKYLEDTMAQCDAKRVDWQSRTKQRSDEVVAVSMALKILTSEAAKSLQKKQTVGQLSFLQTQRTTQRALSKLRSSDHPALSLLAVRAQTHMVSASMTQVQAAADPFKDVKKMVQDMIVKLLNEAAEEADHKEWCDTEMSKSKKLQSLRQKDVSKLESRVEALKAEISALSTSLNELNSNRADMQQAINEATQIRGKEKKLATGAIKEYQDAQVLLTNAMTVLKEYNDKQTSLLQTDDDSDDDGDQPSGGIPGVIGLLEIAVADFAHLETETKSMENTAQNEYDKFMKETEVQGAVWAKDIEYKHTSKVRADGDLQRAQADLEGYKKELTAVTGYIEKLRPSCEGQVDSYEDRKARREKEIKSLQEALAIISGNAIP